MQKVLDFVPSVLNVRRPKPAANQPKNADHIPLPIKWTPNPIEFWIPSEATPKMIRHFLFNVLEYWMAVQNVDFY